MANYFDFNRKCWVPKLRRDPNDWQVRDMIRLLESLGNLNPRSECQGGWIWKLNQNSHFSSKSYYLKLSNCPLLSIPHKGIWNPNIPSRVSFFIWNSFLDKIPTLNHLQSRGWYLANRCILHMEKAESVSHFFIHYSMTKRIWDFFLSHIQIS